MNDIIQTFLRNKDVTRIDQSALICWCPFTSYKAVKHSSGVLMALHDMDRSVVYINKRVVNATSRLELFGSSSHPLMATDLEIVKTGSNSLSLFQYECNNLVDATLTSINTKTLNDAVMVTDDYLNGMINTFDLVNKESNE